MDEHAKVVVVGCGFSGLATAVRLKQAGIEDFLILERADDVGGTWHYNTYPGCRCDVPSHLYSLSFAPNPEWTQTYSAQEEIRGYLRRVAGDFGVRPHLRTGVEVQEATWIAEAARWELATTAGRFTASVVVTGMGPLTEPKVPELPGLETFRGKTMHSARWDHGYALAGKRIASIGTGASAIQYVPEIRRDAARVDVYQRTAPWVMPARVRPINGWEKRLFRRVPAAQKLVRGAVYAGRELLVLGFVKRPRLMHALERLALKHMRRAISDPELLEKVRPDYTLGCKRMLPSNRWYPALAAPNVDLVTAAIAEVREHSIVDVEGIEREVDAIVFGTGFEVTDLPVSHQLRGRDGRRMSEHFGGGPRAYLGTAVPGFPNLFLLLGPNTGLGHSSMVYMIESQVEHVLGALRAMDERGASTIEVRPEALDAYNARLDADLSGSVWDVGGCRSFYLDDTGRNATLWPDFTFRFRRRASRFDPAAYALGAPVPARPEPVAA